MEREILEKRTSMVSFFRKQIERCKEGKHLGTARNYERTLHSLQRFLQGKDIAFSMINGRFVEMYEQWLAAQGLSRNSSSFYIRNIRAVYNKAVKQGLTCQGNPFENVYTGIDRTRKRAVNEEVILRLLQLNLERSKALSLTRDIFVFSYCTRGMAFVDIAFLKKDDITKGFISYVRRKTGKRLSIRIEPCMKSIIERYAEHCADSPYIFPIIKASDNEKAYQQYRIALNYHNRKLKRLGQRIGESISLSSYTARHTWATTARKHNVPMAVISEGMGHTNERTTQIYLASLDNSVIDEANRLIICQLNRAVVG